MLRRLIREANRRRVFRTAAYYVVGSWLVLQVADVLFPGFDIPEAAIQSLLWAAVLGFPVALVFGWRFDIGRHGIQRTPPADAMESEHGATLSRGDYLLLAILVAVTVGIAYSAMQEVFDLPGAKQARQEKAATLENALLSENSIAVLPFSNVSSDPENEYFCDGVSEEILNRLASFRELTVIGRTSSFAFKGSDYSIPRIGGILGVRFLLQGSVRKFGDQLRVSAQLLDANGVQLWNRDFDRTMENLFAIQTEIADTVARTVVPQIVPTADLVSYDVKAYEEYLTGRELYHRGNFGSAIRHLQRAIDLDPNIAEAHAALAIAILYPLLDQDAAHRARQLIDEALSLKPNLVTGFIARGILEQATPTPDLQGSKRWFNEALAQDPDNTNALIWLGFVYYELGEGEKALETLQRAERVDPLHPGVTRDLGELYLERGMKTAAEELLGRALEQPHVGFYAYLFGRAFYRRLGRLVEMNRLAKRQALDLRGPHHYALGVNYALFGDYDTARYWFERSMADFTDYRSVWIWSYGALAPLMSGHYREALDRYRQAMTAMGYTTESLLHRDKQLFGAFLALAGEFEAAISMLEPVIDPEISRFDINVPYTIFWWLEGANILAWAYMETGAADQAASLLASSDRPCRELVDSGNPYLTDQMYHCAQKALLRGDVDAALDRLENAIDGGWREYYLVNHDPRWLPVSDHPRYLALMARARADIDEQHLVVQEMDAGDDFITRLDAAMAAD